MHASEPAADVALLQFAKPPRAVAPVARADSDAVRIGRNVVVIDAQVEQGSSGGGVFDDEGRLIGMVTSVQFAAGRSFGLGFVIASNAIRALLLERRSSGPASLATSWPEAWRTC